MKHFCFFIAFFFISYFTYSQDDYEVNNISCFGNDGIDDVKYQFQTPDGSIIAFVSVEHPNGYFQSEFDNTIWLVKFDNHLNLVAKEFIAKQSDYSLSSGFKFNSGRFALRNPSIGLATSDIISNVASGAFIFLENWYGYSRPCAKAILV